MTNQHDYRAYRAAAAGPANRFLYWDRDGTWAAFVASRLPSSVACNPFSEVDVREIRASEVPTCLLLADDAAAADVLCHCVRRCSEHARTLILVLQRSTDPTLSAMLCEAGAHAVLRSMGELIMWTPAICKWLRDE